MRGVSVDERTLMGIASIAVALYNLSKACRIVSLGFFSHVCLAIALVWIY